MGHQHVDIVKNEWLAGFQVMVARVRLVEEGHLEIDTDDPAMKEVVLRPAAGHDPQADAESFFKHLADLIHGTYLFATEPHDESNCPFREVVVPIHAKPQQHAQPA